jgi:L-alanine-DL-glutamate epimerase-like enolase superfamily enzyme
MDPFYSPGREKIHALDGIDMALWDIKCARSRSERRSPSFDG